MPEDKKYKWIRGGRYLLLLAIDQKKTIRLGRWIRRGRAIKWARRLQLFAGYDSSVIDTKTGDQISIPKDPYCACEEEKVREFESDVDSKKQETAIPPGAHVARYISIDNPRMKNDG
jgi:hypothetical protein